MSNVDSKWEWLFLEELGWSMRVAKELKPRESIFRPQFAKLYLVILVGMLSAVRNKFWKGRTGNIVFVSCSDDGPARAVEPKLGNYVCFAENKLKTIISGSSLVELDALHTLINYKEILPRSIRKFFLRVLLDWVCSSALTKCGCIFVMKEDYSPKCSVLTSLSKRLKINIIGLQHGLFPYHYLKISECYPGLRTRIELAYDPLYASLMIKKKNSGSTVFVLGPPVEKYNGPYNTLPKKTIVYVSGGEFKNENHINYFTEILDNVKLRFCRLGVNFIIRLHPSERAIKSISRLHSYSGSKWELFKCNPRELVFMGCYSTMLYEAGHIGFRTVWLRVPFWLISDLSEIERLPYDSDLSEIESLPNKKIIEYSQLVSEDLNAFFEEPLHPVKIDSLALRLLRLISQSFPGAAERLPKFVDR